MPPPVTPTAYMEKAPPPRAAAYSERPRLLPALKIARSDGSYEKELRRLAKANVLILDDWGLASLEDGERRDVLEILEDRHKRGSTIVTSQLPVKEWHAVIGDPTIADAILDRLVHNAHRIELKKGPSIRKSLAKRGGK